MTSTALLWDLDNVDPGLEALPALATAFRDAVGDGAWLIASGHSTVIGHRRRLLRELGFTVIRGGPLRNGADHRLIYEGRCLMRRRADRLIVASGDKIFSRLAERHDVTLFVLRPQNTSQRLLKTARSVVVFERVDAGFVPEWYAAPAAWRPLESSQRAPGDSRRAPADSGHAVDLQIQF